MSLTRQQAFIAAPIDLVWQLVSDIRNHPRWWPRVVEVECEEIGEGCTYRQITQTPFGKDDMNLLIESMDGRDLSIRCVNTGTFIRMRLAEAQDGTFVEGEMGMEPDGLAYRAFDVIAGRLYFRSWMSATFEALEREAREDEPAGAGSAEPA